MKTDSSNIFLERGSNGLSSQNGTDDSYKTSKSKLHITVPLSKAKGKGKEKGKGKSKSKKEVPAEAFSPSPMPVPLTRGTKKRIVVPSFQLSNITILTASILSFRTRRNH